MKIDYLIEKRVKEMKKHFEEDGWDIDVRGIIQDLTNELENDNDFKTLITESIEKACNVKRVTNNQGDEVFRK